MAPDTSLRERLEWLADGATSRGPRTFYLECRLVRCGKVPCRCASGSSHGPFFYLRLADHLGRRRRIYIPRRNVTQVHRWIQEFRRRQSSERLAWALIRRWYG